MLQNKSTERGVQKTASAVIYSIVETAKANNLNPYYYFEHLLTEIPKLKEFNTPEEEASAMERLLPWSADLPEKATMDPVIKGTWCYIVFPAPVSISHAASSALIDEPDLL